MSMNHVRKGYSNLVNLRTISNIIEGIRSTIHRDSGEILYRGILALTFILFLLRVFIVVLIQNKYDMI